MSKYLHVTGHRVDSRNFVDTTSRAASWSRGLSPFLIGPCVIDWGGGEELQALNMENAWQFSKVYGRDVTDRQSMKPHVTKDGEPTPAYFRWAEDGFNTERAIRYPMHKGAVPKYSFWAGEQLTYIEARKRIYCPLYAAAVEETDAYKKLQKLYKEGREIFLWDFDAYSIPDVKESTLRQALNEPGLKMGHSFVLAMMLTKQRVWEENG